MVTVGVFFRFPRKDFYSKIQSPVFRNCIGRTDGSVVWERRKGEGDGRIRNYEQNINCLLLPQERLQQTRRL